MGVAVLNPQDCLKHPLSHMKHPRNPPSACPNQRQRKTISNRTRRSPPRKQTSPPSPPVTPSLPPLATVTKKSPNNNNNNVGVGQVRILKRGEEIPKKTDLVSTRMIGPDPGTIPSQIRLPVRKSKTAPFYAGPVTMTSPPPSDVPLPAFFAAKKSVSLLQATDATNHLIRVLRLDIARVSVSI